MPLYLGGSGPGWDLFNGSIDEEIGLLEAAAEAVAVAMAVVSMRNIPLDAIPETLCFDHGKIIADYMSKRRSGLI